MIIRNSGWFLVSPKCILSYSIIYLVGIIIKTFFLVQNNFYLSLPLICSRLLMVVPIAELVADNRDMRWSHVSD